MSSKNPETLHQGGEKRPVAGESAGKTPIDSQSVPRTAAGVVNDAGQILDHEGRVIGKISESLKPSEFTGSTVTAGGEILGSSGDVLGKAILHDDDHSEYTTQSPEIGKDNTNNEGWNLLGKTKSAYNTAQALHGPAVKGLGLLRELRTPKVENEGSESQWQKEGGAKSQEESTPRAVSDVKEGKDNLNTDSEDKTPQIESQSDIHDDAKSAIQMKDSEETDEAPAVPKEAHDTEEKLHDVDREDEKLTKTKTETPALDKSATEKKPAEVEPHDESVDTKDKLDDVDLKEDNVEESATTGKKATHDTVDESVDVPKTSDTKDKLDDAPVKDSHVDETTNKDQDIFQDKSDGSKKDALKKDDLENKDKLDDSPVKDSRVEETTNKGQDVVQNKSDDSKEDTLGKDDLEKNKLDDSQTKDERLEETTNKGQDVVQDKVDDAKEDAVTKDNLETVDDKQSKVAGITDVSTSDAKDGLDDSQKQLDSDEKQGKDEEPEEVKSTKDKLDGDKPADDLPTDQKKEREDDEKDGKKPTENVDEAKDDTATVAAETEAPVDKADDVAPPTEEAKEEDKLDFASLKGTKVNKAGNLVNKDGDIVGRLVQGDAKRLLGKRCDDEGKIWDDAGKVVGKAEPLPDDESSDLKSFATFENFPDATVEADGRVMSGGRQVGSVIEGDPKRLKGSKVDEDGDILDRRGNVVGKAEAWDEPEPEPESEVDRSILAGKRVNKAGNVVDGSGSIYGRVIEGNVSSMVGRMCDKKGNILSESGDVIGKAEVISEGEREGLKEGPFAELSGCTVSKDGKVVTPSGDVVGRLIKGDGKVLYGRSVDEDGDVLDRNGNVIGKAERWEEPEVEKKKSPLAGKKVNRDGNVLDEDGNIMAKLISGDKTICTGKEVDEDGDVINSKGNTVGHVALLEDIPPEPEESAEDKAKRETAEKETAEAEKDRKLAQQLAGCIEQALDRVRPICKMITDKIDRAEKTPKEELDEEQLVREVKPLIEEGGKILSELNGTIRGLDPDGRIQRNAKHKSGTKDASSEEYHLADVLKELTTTVTQTIDNAKRKIEGMPHAKKELNPLWGLLGEPLVQIIAAVGLLLTGVLNLVGRLLSGLGLGGLVDSLLGGLGLKQILSGLGLGGAVDALTGKNDGKKKKGLLF